MRSSRPRPSRYRAAYSRVGLYRSTAAVDRSAFVQGTARAIRMLFDWRVLGRILPINPAKRGSWAGACSEERQNPGTFRKVSPPPPRLNRHTAPLPFAPYHQCVQDVYTEVRRTWVRLHGQAAQDALPSQTRNVSGGIYYCSWNSRRPGSRGAGPQSQYQDDAPLCHQATQCGTFFLVTFHPFD